MFKMRNVVTWLAIGVLLYVSTSSARADVILSNLPATGSGTGTNLGLGTDLGDRTKAVGLTMGATSLEFQSMEALISNTTPDSVLSGGIFSSSGGNPGVLLSAFNSVPIAANFAPAEVSLTTASSFTLLANASYWFVLDGPDTENSLLWESLDPNVAPTPNGVAYDGYRFSINGGPWGDSGVFNGVRINAVPEPTSLLIALLSSGLLLVFRRP